MAARNVLAPRDTGKLISERSSDVTIDDASVEVAATMLAESFVTEEFSMASWKEETLHPDEASESSVAFIFVMDTLNFCFWPEILDRQSQVTYKGKSYTRYWSLVAALRRALDEGIPITSAEYMAAVTVKQLQHVFRSDNEVEMPMLKERAEALNEAGRVLLDNFKGSFVNCIKQCGGNALSLLGLIVQHFKSYRDEAVFDGRRVAFYKRPQILIADVWLCYEGKDLGEFHNIDQLTMFADYRVPQALEYLGILRYSKELKRTLDNLTVLESGHRYELEIRGCSIEAVERLQRVIRSVLAKQKAGITRKLAPVNSITVDNYLWMYAKSHSMQMDHLPHHRVRTIFY